MRADLFDLRPTQYGDLGTDDGGIDQKRRFSGATLAVVLRPGALVDRSSISAPSFGPGAIALGPEADGSAPRIGFHPDYASGGEGVAWQAAQRLFERANSFVNFDISRFVQPFSRG